MNSQRRVTVAVPFISFSHSYIEGQSLASLADQRRAQRCPTLDDYDGNYDEQ